MAPNAWKFVAVAILAAGAIATAAPLSSRPEARGNDALETRPASAEQICTDAQVGETLGGNPNGCREYLDACLGDLTAAQRAEWRKSVEACLADPDTALFRCYALVPWC
jgi:hypothetical protein